LRKPDALQIAMMLDLKPGDEVITADFICCDCGSDCFIATDPF
jgi:hypothetical protein